MISNFHNLKKKKEGENKKHPLKLTVLSLWVRAYSSLSLGTEPFLLSHLTYSSILSNCASITTFPLETIYWWSSHFKTQGSFLLFYLTFRSIHANWPISPWISSLSFWNITLPGFPHMAFPHVCWNSQVLQDCLGLSLCLYSFPDDFTVIF